jgi:serine/threonine-protein kinase
VDHRADVYAVGVLAFEMLTGVLPLEASTPAATIAAHRTLTPDPPSRRVVGIPPEVDALVLRALAKRPEDRFGTMSEIADEAARIRRVLASELERAWTPLGAGAAPPGRPSGAFRPSRPRGDTVSLPDAPPVAARPFRRAAAALAVALAALGAVAAGWAWRAATEARRTASATPPPATAVVAAPAPAPNSSFAAKDSKCSPLCCCIWSNRRGQSISMLT